MEIIKVRETGNVDEENNMPTLTFIYKGKKYLGVCSEVD